MADSGKVPEIAPAPTAQTSGEAAPATAAATTSAPAGILPASHWAQASLPEFPPGDDDADSLLESDTASSTASLTASILEYRTIHGRTFHSELGNGQSWTPNDEQHGESMDINHHMCTLCLDGKLFLAPLKPDIQKVLDIGTGTGIWAIDFADQFPSAEVIGTDLSPIQPTFVPPNCKFELDDANQDWTWPDNTFDFIHIRNLFGAVEDWGRLYRQAFRVCKPGGWFEDYESSAKMDSDDGSVLPDSPMDQWAKVFWEGGRRFGRTLRVVEDGLQKKCMEEAGFVDIRVWEFKCPIGPWPRDPKLKEIGEYAKLVLESDAEGYVLYMWTTVMGWSPEEVQVYLSHFRRQLRAKNVHPWIRHRVVYGRKPE